MTEQGYTYHFPKGSIGADALHQRGAACALCGGARAIGAGANPVCCECRLRLGEGEEARWVRGLVELAADAKVATAVLAAAVRDGRGLPVERCESCGALVPAGALFDVFGVGRCCRRCAGLDGAAPAAGWGHPDNSFDFADVDFDGDRWLLARSL